MQTRALKHFLRSHDITQKQVAESLGLAQYSVHRTLNGQASKDGFRLGQLERLARLIRDRLGRADNYGAAELIAEVESWAEGKLLQDPRRLTARSAS